MKKIWTLCYSFDIKIQSSLAIDRGKPQVEPMDVYEEYQKKFKMQYGFSQYVNARYVPGPGQ